MTTLTLRRRAAALCPRAFAIVSALCAVFSASSPVRGQTSAATAPEIRPGEEETIHLTPFEVNTDRDTGYGALQSNSLTAFRIDLEKMPATAQVFTSTFMQDLGATSIQSVLMNYSGVVGADPNNLGAALAMPGDRDGSGGGVGIRGLSAGSPRRDGLNGPKVLTRSAFGYTDNFSADRVELIEGPQSLLYGAVGGGGVINIVSKRANFDQRKGSVQTQIDNYGSKRAMFDYNYGAGKIAVRVAGVTDERRNVRYNLSTDFYGLYTQIAYKLGAQTTLRVFHELTNNRGNVAFNPSSSDISTFLPIGDPRRGQDVRYLALTNQLTDLQGILTDAPVDYDHISSYGSWWSSELIRNKYSGFSVESNLGAGFSAQLTAIYTETLDERATVGKNVVPAAGLPGSGANPFSETAVRVTPGDNWQSDRTKGFRLNIVHDRSFELWRLRGRSQSALGIEGFHQGPAFGSSGIDRMYYQADENWNPIINPAVTLDYGRIPLSNVYFPIQHGIPLKPLFRPSTRRITVNGQNYVLQPRIYSDPSTRTEQNPFGLIPNNPGVGTGYAGNWNRGGETHARLANIANYTEWFDGRLATMAGASINRFTTLNAGPGNVTYLAPRNYWGYQYGANYEVWRGLRVYATIGTAAQAAGTTKDYYGNALKVPKATSPTPEVGIKYFTPDGKFGLQAAYNFTTQVENETRNAGADLFNAVNPNGINGRFNGGDQWINLDRKSNSAELVVTANPTRNWRMRFAAIKLDGEITSTVKYQQLYNDQFYTSNGTVTYRDGSPVLVDPAGAGGVRNTPLTLAMINNPASPYYAAPDANSGRITRSALITVLTEVDPVHGPAATGATGLPISAIQYNFSNPLGGEVTVVSEGDKNTGINEYTFNFQSNYSFSSGPLKGLSVFGDVRTYQGNRAYYTSYFPTSTTGNALQARRELYRLPPATVVGLGLSYTYKFDKCAFTTQLNVNNLFNHYKVWVVPSIANGAILNARLSNQPREILWTNTISF